MTRPEVVQEMKELLRFHEETVKGLKKALCSLGADRRRRSWSKQRSANHTAAMLTYWARRKQTEAAEKVMRWREGN